MIDVISDILVGYTLSHKLNIERPLHECLFNPKPWHYRTIVIPAQAGIQLSI